MIKTILVATLSIMFNHVGGQMEMTKAASWTTIGELRSSGKTKAKLQYTVSGDDTTYMLFMKDMRKQQEPDYFSVSFNAFGDSLNKLYKLLLSFFKNDNKKNRQYSETFKLGNSYINLQHYRLIGTAGVMFTTKEAYTYFSEKDIDKLFGKN